MRVCTDVEVGVADEAVADVGDNGIDTLTCDLWVVEADELDVIDLPAVELALVASVGRESEVRVEVNEVVGKYEISGSVYLVLPHPYTK